MISLSEKPKDDEVPAGTLEAPDIMNSVLANKQKTP